MLKRVGALHSTRVEAEGPAVEALAMVDMMYEEIRSDLDCWRWNLNVCVCFGHEQGQ